MSMKYKDGEVISVDTDGCLICWDADTQQQYNCGETVEQYGRDNLTCAERYRVLFQSMVY